MNTIKFLAYIFIIGLVNSQMMPNRNLGGFGQQNSLGGMGQFGAAGGAAAQRGLGQRTGGLGQRASPSVGANGPTGPAASRRPSSPAGARRQSGPGGARGPGQAGPQQRQQRQQGQRIVSPNRG